ncbi:hypothetical protein E4198_00055 [Streptomyces sp. RKND-216]|uniref:hypothetical protein n=1 Tax=Streptomyces sp. RKND-216 TaxID=2562581 RepID=UPI00109D9BFE|nr:hypothetical protein [Streptomyces sp. RKND-216]THA28243.1 hypothetical protein E4198_00055 [Streptomyces sp. RKND-216]
MRWERGHDPVGPTWTTLDNLIIDDDLSCRALGLLTRWLRRPPGAELDSITDMIKRAKRAGKKRMEGRDALYGASYELEAAGYLVRELATGAGGRHEWVVRIYAQPVPPEHRSDPQDRKRGSTKQSRSTPKEQPSKQPKSAKPQVAPITGFQESGNQESGSPDSEDPDSGNQASSYKDSLNDSLSGHSRHIGDSPRAEGARETATPNSNAPGPVPLPRSSGAGQRTVGPTAPASPTDDERLDDVLSMLSSLPGKPGRHDALDLAPLVMEALEGGMWTLPALRRHLARRCDPDRVFDVGAIYRHQLKRLPDTPPTGDHPATISAATRNCDECHGSGFAHDPTTFLPLNPLRPCACRKALEPSA